MYFAYDADIRRQRIFTMMILIIQERARARPPPARRRIAADRRGGDYDYFIARKSRRTMSPPIARLAARLADHAAERPQLAGHFTAHMPSLATGCRSGARFPGDPRPARRRAYCAASGQKRREYAGRRIEKAMVIAAMLIISSMQPARLIRAGFGTSDTSSAPQPASRQRVPMTPP